MALTRTSILPLDDMSAARAMLNSCLQKEKTTVMIVLGNTQTIQQDISIVDFYAGEVLQDFERWAVWAKDKQMFEQDIAPLLANADDPVDTDYEDVKAFSLSPVSRKAAGVIHKNTELNDLFVNKSFINAETVDKDAN